MTAQTPLIDIRPDHWEIVRSILQKNVPHHAVWAFGSRATWKAKEYSDLDLAIITDRPLSLDVSASLSDDFSESDLPWRVDVVDWATTSEAFRKIIERDKVVVWEGGGLGMSNDWRTVSLGEIFKVKHGFAFKSEYFTDEPQDTVLVTPGNFAIGGGFQDGKRKYYNGQLLEDYILKPGQVVVTMTDLSKESDTLGYSASIPKSSTIWLHNQRVGLLEFKNETPTSPRFIEYLLRTHEYRSWIIGSATGTTVKHTAPGRIESFTTRIPPIDEQRAIAHILGTLDDKIELNRKQNETLEAMARALFKAWFVDFEPVRAKMEGHVGARFIAPNPDFIAPNPDDMGTDHSGTDHLGAVRSDAVHWGDIHLGAGHLGAINRAPTGWPKHILDLFPDRLVESELGEIPEGWEVTSVDIEFDITMGQSPPGNTYNETGEGIPFYQGRADFEFRFPKRRVYCTAPTRFAKSGDTLVSVRAPVGDINMAFEACAIGRGVSAVRHKSGCRSYTYQFMRSISDVFARFDAEGTVFGSIGKKDFHSIAHVKPPRDLVLAYENLVTQMDDQIERNERESLHLAQLRDTLLPKLISGELRIPDAEAFLRERGL